MQLLTQILKQINDYVWGLPLICLLLGTGIYFTFKLRLIQLTKLKLAFKCIFKKHEGEGDVSSFQALCTALSSTIGTGNIVGVATAIAAGGPGALFWMWISAFFGMATKYAEGLLAIRYRQKDENGEIAGGPMYYLEKGLRSPLLAKIFAFFGVSVALLGIGTFTQVKSISDALTMSLSVPRYVTAILLTIAVAFITIGGIKRIASVAEKVIPFMCVLYIGGVILILVSHITVLPSTIALIIKSAFTPQAVFGGGTGITMVIAMQKGISRGIFSNESGLGSAPIAAAAAKTDSCVEQGLVSMTGTFIDTIIVCTMTGLAIVMTGAWDMGLEGVAVTTKAFALGLPFPAKASAFVLMMCLVFFAFTTILGWAYYSERCLEYLVNGKKFVITAFKWFYILAVFIGPFMTVSAVWTIADICNGLMAFPNLVALLALNGDVVSETRGYLERVGIVKTTVGEA